MTGPMKRWTSIAMRCFHLCGTFQNASFLQGEAIIGNGLVFYLIDKQGGVRSAAGPRRRRITAEGILSDGSISGAPGGIRSFYRATDHISHKDGYKAAL